MNQLHISRALALLIVMTAPVAARASDVVSQDLTVDVTGDTLHVEIDARVVFDGPLPIYTLVLPAVAITVDGEPATLPVETDPQYQGLVQWLTPADDVALDGVTERDVHIAIDGIPSCASRLQPGLDSCAFRDDEIVLLPFEPGAAWYLTNLFGADPFTGSVTAHAPASLFVAAGQGAPAAVDTLDDGTVRSRFDIVVDTEGLGFFARTVDTVTATSSDGKVFFGGVPHGGSAGGGGPSGDDVARAAMQRVVDTGARVLPRYEAMFGALPFDEVHYLPVSGRYSFGGMGLLGDIFLGDFVTWPQFDYIVEQGAAHELAHSWWGGLTSSEDQNAGGFLQESFAEYSAWRALGEDDDDVRTSGVRMNAVWYMTQIGDGDTAILDAANDPDAYVLVTYHKGSTVVRSLEQHVGEDVFTAAMRAVVERGPTAFTVDALVEEIQNAGGGDVSAYLDQWIGKPGYPKLAVGFDGKALSVDVDGGYDLDIPVRTTSSDGTVREQVLTASAATASVKAELDAGTVLVEVDPRWTLVRAVTPKVAGDVSLDGRVDAVDLMEIALHAGGAIPDARRVDGHYDPLYDLDNSGAVDDADLDAVLAALP